MDAQSKEARIVADPAFGSRPWNRMILGHFIEHFHRQIYGGLFEPGSPLADARGFRTDVIAAVREMGTPIMRWPGGNYVSDHHWQEAIGPDRVPSYNKAWRVVEPNTFGTDEFLAWCDAVGCEPYLCTNAGNGTPEEMSNWVEYCNGHLDTRYARQRRTHGRDAPYGVKYWGIGNESYGDWQIGAKTVADWGPYVAESAKMMRAVDESIVLSAAAVPDTEWTLALLRAAGRHLDLVSIHGYWDHTHHKDEPKGYLACMLACADPEVQIRRTRSVIDAAGFTDRIAIAFDEWNLRGWHHPDGTGADKIAARDRNDIAATYTMADAIFSASFLNACLRNADVVTMANVAPTVNTRGPLFVHPEGIVRRTTFHLMRLYADHLRERVIATSVSSGTLDALGGSIPLIDAVVTTDARGATAIITNRHPDAAVSCALQVEGRRPDGVFDVEILDGDSPDAFNDVASPVRVAPRRARIRIADGRIEIPAHSVCAVTMDDAAN